MSATSHQDYWKQLWTLIGKKEVPRKMPWGEAWDGTLPVDASVRGEASPLALTVYDSPLLQKPPPHLLACDFYLMSNNQFCLPWKTEF